MSDGFKIGKISLVGDKPMQLTPFEEAIGPSPPEEHRDAILLIGKAVKEYRDAAKRLLGGKYSHLRELAPNYLAEPGNILVACCQNGVVIRYERKSDDPKLFTGWMSEDLAQTAAMLSQNIIHCHTNPNFTSTTKDTGLKLAICSCNEHGGDAKELLTLRIGFNVVIKNARDTESPKYRPRVLATVRNSMELGIVGELCDEGGRIGEGQRFVTRSVFRLPVGWECIEIYPGLDPNDWDLDNAEAWAECDILATVTAHQFREGQYQSLDPKAGARREFGALLDRFEALLDSEPDREETLQVFLRDNPALLCPNQTKKWPKLALGAKVTDFVFQGLVGEYVLVELEKSTDKLFRQNGHATANLNEAKRQITDWKRYIEDNLKTVQDELGLKGISTNPNGLVVIGRSGGLTDADRRKLRTMNNEQPTLRIMTYDDVYDNAKAVIENLFGPIWRPVGQTQIYYI